MRKLGVVPLVGLAVGYLCILGIIWYAVNDATNRQTAIVGLTGLVVVWYTWETALLRREMIRQTEVQVRPYVIAHPTTRHLTVENVGNVPALDVHVEDMVIDKWPQLPSGERLLLTLRFPLRFPVLRPGEKQEIPVETLLGGREFGNFFGGHIDPNFATVESKLVVHFKNVELTGYSVTQIISPGKWAVGDFSGPIAV